MSDIENTFDLDELYEYACSFHEGNGKRKNYKKAFSIYCQLVEQEYIDAYFYMGLYYQMGYAVKKDYDLALYYYVQGAAHNDECCFNQLGVLYGKGLGVKKNPALAIRFYEIAAELGERTAFSNLAYFYETGKGTDKDIVKALLYYRMADNGSKDTKDAIERCEAIVGALKFRCPCCGYYTLDTVAEYDICPVCFWEDDFFEYEENDDMTCNNVSINEGQENFKKYGAYSPEHIKSVRPPTDNELNGFERDMWLKHTRGRY